MDSEFNCDFELEVSQDESDSRNTGDISYITQSSNIDSACESQRNVKFNQDDIQPR